MSRLGHIVASSLLAMLGQVSTGGTPASAQSAPGVDIQLANRELDSLERVAQSSPSADERVEAVFTAGIYFGRPDGSKHVPGVAARLARLYRNSGDHAVRFVLVKMMALQGDQAVAAAFLAEVAQEPGVASPRGRSIDRGFAPPIQVQAVAGLERLGVPGKALLQSLDLESITEPRAKQRLINIRAGRSPDSLK